ncbi:MAG: right-handed parallel beta-helix repeat-containing protein, partial [Paludibacteraceae bacterium]|nr:right-handed parallel beta-helix repeat-containing protein [Paludibacteraceae bacterium]
MKRIFSLILALMAVQMMWAAPYTVTNTSDDVEKEGSLRWACNQASSNKSVEITFDIEGDGNKVIKLTNQIQIQGNVTIDASSSKDSIIIDANDMEFSDYCFYLNNDKTTKLSLKGLVLKNKKTSAIYSYTYNDSENTLDVLIDSCFLYSSITTYGGNFVIKKSSVFSNVIASYSTSTSLEIVDCEFVDCQHAYCCLLSADIAKFICSRTTFNRKIVDGSNPIHYNSQSIYSAPVIDTAYVKNGMLFVKGHVASEEIVDIELFSACGSYDPKSSHNRYDCTKYIGATKTNSKGIFSCELTLPEKGVKTKQHFVLSATATYSKAHTSSFAFYDVIQPYWVVTNTEAGSVIYASPVGSMGWACYFAGTNDTIAFDFPGKGTKEIEGNDVFSTNAFVDGSTYADTIILHGLECRNVNKIVSQNSTKINGFYVSEKITNCIARGNSKGITISSPDCYIENCIAENNTDAGISTSVGGKARVIKNSVVRNNKVGIGCGARLIENCEITNNSEKGIAAASNTYDIDTIRGCLISGNDIGIDGDI